MRKFAGGMTHAARLIPHDSCRHDSSHSKDTQHLKSLNESENVCAKRVVNISCFLYCRFVRFIHIHIYLCFTTKTFISTVYLYLYLYLPTYLPTYLSIYTYIYIYIYIYIYMYVCRNCEANQRKLGSNFQGHSQRPLHFCILSV